MIVVDSRLGRQLRNEALAHELIHHERGGGAGRDGMPSAWRDIEARDEAQVGREVARRLLPLGALELWVRAKVQDDGQVTAFDVAEEFDVTEQLATVALGLLPAID